MKKLFLIIALLALPFSSFADNNKYRHDRNHHEHHGHYAFWNKVNRRLDRQFNRIERGIQNGELTRREAKRLHRQHRKLDKRIDRIRNSRWIDRSDRRYVMAHLDKASDKIYRLKHNDRYVRKDRYRDHHHYNTRYSNDRHVAWSNNDHSAGFFLRF